MATTKKIDTAYEQARAKALNDQIAQQNAMQKQAQYAAQQAQQASQGPMEQLTPLWKQAQELHSTAETSAVSNGRPTAAQEVSNGRPTYSGTYEQQLADIYDRIQNREKFKYDVNADPLYQQYKDQYIQGGKLAMRDTMGKAAALNGGYGSTYAQQVGQQAYDSYLQSLTEQIPELYQTALSKYNDEGNQFLQQYGLVGDMRDTEYNRWRTDVGDWENQRAWDYQVEQDAWQKQQQAYSNLYQAIMQTGYSPTDAELAAAGMTREQASAAKAMWDRMYAQVATGGGGGYYGGGSSSSKKATDSNTGGGTYTFKDIAGAYDTAKSGGSGKDASQILAAAVQAKVITPTQKKEIVQQYRVKDKI